MTLYKSVLIDLFTDWLYFISTWQLCSQAKVKHLRFGPQGRPSLPPLSIIFVAT